MNLRTQVSELTHVRIREKVCTKVCTKVSDQVWSKLWGQNYVHITYRVQAQVLTEINHSKECLSTKILKAVSKSESMTQLFLSVFGKFEKVSGYMRHLKSWKSSKRDT
jgi:hypothetical protein